MRNFLNVAHEGLLIILSTVALVLGIVYAQQLARAPLYSNTPPRPSRGSLILTYGLLPVLTLFESMVAICLYFTVKASAWYRLILASLLAVGWLIVVVIWGHCHSNAKHDADNPWYDVCYQTKIPIQWATGYPTGVSKGVGSALVAVGALILIWYCAIVSINAVAAHRNRRKGSPRDP
ncbi:hypothetical protein BDV96DRAFT_654525 [Lophiotrema nucula]|uniref:MARVEL domain-containing protein n=1 Tax=Lophiotrema nucula TaxID=690887 RepID=A0A6A5YJ29_9PLEO|nr:hypothetical protein BDV96DRAFT_654525 [Lophiotrema nucula]